MVTGLKNTFGLIEEATDSGLKPLMIIQKTGKKKTRTSTQVSVVTRPPRTVRVIDFLQP